MKIGILTFHNAMNYGAILQCYALQSYLEANYVADVSIINYTPEYFKKVFYDPMKPLSAYGVKGKIRACAKLVLRYKEMKYMSIKHRKLSKFVNENLHISAPIVELDECNYDVFVAGSDQIWNLELLGNDKTYFLDLVKKGKRVSYAASFKVSDVDDYAKSIYEKYLPMFDAISVRETNLKEYLAENIGINASCVIDPTLLVENNLWKSLQEESALIKDRYILLYHVNKPVNLVKEAFVYAKQNNMKVVSLNPLRGVDDYIDYSMASIPEFLNLIANAEAVFTTSFHGMAFSINYQRNFYFEVPENSYNNNERLLDLARKLGLENRNIAANGVVQDINWDDVKKRLESERHIASVFLDKAVKEIR